MADNKREQERSELHRAIWSIANDLRGSVDGWDFKHYVLGILFYRYVSENIASYINKGEWEAGNKTFSYANLSDSDAEQAREDLVKTKGFFVLPSELFENVQKNAKDDENLNETLETIFNNRETIDITVLNAKIEGIVARENELRNEISAIIAEIEG